MPSYLIVLLTFAWLAILVGGWLGWQLLRQNGRLLLRLDELEQRLNELEFGESEEPEGLPLGSEAPAFELPDLTGERQSLTQFRGQPVLMVFFNPGCGYCRELVPKLAAPFGVRRQAERDAALDAGASTLHASQSAVTAGAVQNSGGLSLGEHPMLLLISTGDAQENRQFFAEYNVSCPVLLQNNGEVAKAYQANGTPTGYLVGAEGKIASGLAIGAEALLGLAEGKAADEKAESGKQKTEIERTASVNGDGRADRFSKPSLSRSKIKRDGLKAGTPAPDFRLPRLDGRGDLTLSELRGRRVLLVFSSPGCGPCNTLAPEIEKFHRQHPEVEVVMISKGEPKENRAKVKEHGLTFPVVLQQQWEISRRYAMFATPIAYLIDEQSITIHDVAVGTDGILELLAKCDGCNDGVNRMEPAPPTRISV